MDGREMDMIGGAKILKQRIEQRRKLMAETNAKELEIFQGNDELWYWHAKAGNGEIIAQGEGMNTRENATRAAEDAFPGVPLSVSTTINEEGGNSMSDEQTQPSEGEAAQTDDDAATDDQGNAGDAAQTGDEAATDESQQ